MTAADSTLADDLTRAPIAIKLPFAKADLVDDTIPLITVESADGHLLWHFRIDIGGVDAPADE